MKTLGIVGGIGPESTVDYYRSLIRMWRDQTMDGSAPSILVNSIDLKKMLDLIAANKLSEVTAYLSGEMEKLARAGADVGLLTANSAHIVFDELQRRSSIPLISIVEATCCLPLPTRWKARRWRSSRSTLTQSPSVLCLSRIQTLSNGLRGIIHLTRLTAPRFRGRRTWIYGLQGDSGGCMIALTDGERPAIAGTKRSSFAYRLVGVWSLVSYIDEQSNRDDSYPFGQDPQGFLIYTPNGFVSAQLMKMGRPAFHSRDWHRGTPDEYQTSGSGYIAYCGTYEVDEEKATVTHIPSVSLLPNLIDGRQCRSIEFEGDRLVLRAAGAPVAGGMYVTSRLEWLRIIPKTTPSI